MSAELIDWNCVLFMETSSWHRIKAGEKKRENKGKEWKKGKKEALFAGMELNGAEKVVNSSHASLFIIFFSMYVSVYCSQRKDDAIEMNSYSWFIDHLSKIIILSSPSTRATVDSDRFWNQTLAWEHWVCMWWEKRKRKWWRRWSRGSKRRPDPWWSKRGPYWTVGRFRDGSFK